MGALESGGGETGGRTEGRYGVALLVVSITLGSGEYSG